MRSRLSIGVLFLILLWMIFPSAYASALYLPENTTRIESLAFSGISVDQIVFPDSIEFIADDAFENSVFSGVGNYNTYSNLWCLEHGFDYNSLSSDTPLAYIMYADASWTSQYWGSPTEGINATDTPITGPGIYTVALNFANLAHGLAFASLAIRNGETVFPGYFIDIQSIIVNGIAIEFTKNYTTSDDGLETRTNIYNEWVNGLPEDAHCSDGNLEGVSPIIVDRSDFESVSSIEITFEYIFGEPLPKKPDIPLTEEEADALKANGFKAYIGVQGKDTYVFRNAWNDSYDLNDDENPFFYRLTGWDEYNNAVDYGGTFVDADITTDGEYTVSLTTGEMGFGSTEAFNLLFVSTNIPSKLVADGFLTNSDVKTKLSDAPTQEYTNVDVSDDYVRLVVLDSYILSSEPFGYIVPGPNQTISISFQVTGF